MSRQIVLTWDDAEWTPGTEAQMLALVADQVTNGCIILWRTSPDTVELVKETE